MTIDLFDKFTAEIRIKALVDQIRENEYRGRIGNFRDLQWWYAKANDSLVARIKYYSQFVV